MEYSIRTPDRPIGKGKGRETDAAMFKPVPEIWQDNSERSFGELLFPSGQKGASIQVFLSTTSSASSSSEELFFDCVSMSNQSRDTALHDQSSTPYLLFDPVVESVADTTSLDWRRYDPPEELLYSDSNTSREIRDLLDSSIKRIQSQHAEEDARRLAAARPERPLRRSRRASAKPRLEIPESSNSRTASNESRSRALSVNSANSAASNDSGYATASTAKSPKRGIFPLFSFFKRQPTSADQSEEQESAKLELGTLECVSCLEDFEAAKLVKLTCHSYCSGCFQQLISTALESETHWPVKCCLNPIPTASILPHLDKKARLKFEEREQEWSVPAGDRIYCSQATCSAWILPNCINRKTNTARCPKCTKRSCATCHGAAHQSGDCPRDTTIQATVNLAEQEGWKQCYNCHAYVEHNQGCRHMTCRCKAQFCYICSARWRTCACTDAQLADIAFQAMARRQGIAVRTAAERAEAEEMRAAIQAVADYEEAERVRAAIEAQAQRQREEEERQGREAIRISSINARFQTLRTELEALTDIQRVQIVSRYEAERKDNEREFESSMDMMAIRHATEVQRLGMESQQRISDAEFEYKSEYKARIAADKELEADFTQLKGGRKGAEEGIRAAMAVLKDCQQREFWAWNEERKREMSVILRSERQFMEGLRTKLDAEKRAGIARKRNDAVEMERIVDAEAKWVDEVVRVRAQILREAEERVISDGNM